MPALPGPAQPSPTWRLKLGGWLLPLLLLLPLALTGCGGIGQPPRSALLQALELQIQLTQGSIAEALALEPGGAPEVSRVRVAEQEEVRIGTAKGMRIVGEFDWRLPGDPIRVDSPFALYLQRGEQGQSWRLARPSGATGENGAQLWITDPLPVG